ncbi:MAG: hypothetical protein IPK50_23850 [Fibrobacterota bacterium]|nr:hypothetical protein [Fibrobacterota bacterium]QQS05268.1 MAG: hypothetical protein IPK50_23850 [Fibrobacterota bacterium]
MPLPPRPWFLACAALLLLTECPAWSAKPVLDPAGKFQSLLKQAGIYESRLLPKGCLTWKQTPLGKDSVRLDPILAKKSACAHLRAEDSWIMPLDGTSPVLLGGSGHDLRIPLDLVVTSGQPSVLEGKEPIPGQFKEDTAFVDVILAGGGGSRRIQMTRNVVRIAQSASWGYINAWKKITRGETTRLFKKAINFPSDSSNPRLNLKVLPDGIWFDATLRVPLLRDPSTGREHLPDSAWKDSLIGPLVSESCNFRPGAAIGIEIDPDVEFSLLASVLRTLVSTGHQEAHLTIAGRPGFEVELMQPQSGQWGVLSWPSHSCDSAGTDLLLSTSVENTNLWWDLLANRTKLFAEQRSELDTLTPSELSKLSKALQSAASRFPTGRWIGIQLEPDVRVSRLAQLASIVPSGRRIALYGTFRNNTRLTWACKRDR